MLIGRAIDDTELVALKSAKRAAKTDETMMKYPTLIMTMAVLFSLPAISHALPVPQIPVVPEPSTFYAGAALLVPLGIAAVTAARRRSRKK